MKFNIGDRVKIKGCKSSIYTITSRYRVFSLCPCSQACFMYHYMSEVSGLMVVNYGYGCQLEKALDRVTLK